MSGPQDEIGALRAQVAVLTARVHQLEQLAGVDSKKTAASPPLGTMLEPPNAPLATGAPSLPRMSAPPQVPALAMASRTEHSSLEKKIGQYWLNRIGIVAILIG